MELTPMDALALRMNSLLLTARSRPTDVAGVVTWFGAMQAQDMASAMWSLGVRLPALTSADVHDALERREALRTWPMRGTVHLVPPRDAHWMLEIMGVRALSQSAARRATLGLTEEVAERAIAVLVAALTGGGRLTRSRCLATLAEAGILTAGQLGYHLLLYASQRGVLCIAPHIGKEQSFVLLDEWVPDPHRPERDKALATIARRYFRSHGPTTRRDFVGWTGLTATDAKRGIAAAGDELAMVWVDGVEMYLDPALLDAGPAGGARPAAAGDGVLALPGFDEYMLGYKDRSLMLAAEHQQAIIPGGNGVFQSTIVRDGRVIGTWKRTVKRDRLLVDVRPLIPLGTPDRKRVERALAPFARYSGQPLEIRWPDA